MDSDTASPVPLLSPAQGTPTLSFPSSLSPTEQEGFLNKEDVPQVDAVVEGPLFRASDGETAPEEGAESAGTLPGSDGEQALLPAALPIKSAAKPEDQVSSEDDGVADEVFDAVLAGDAGGSSSPSQVAGAVPVPLPGEVVGSPDSVVGGDGVVEENEGDDEEKESTAVEVTAPDGNCNLELGPDHGFAGDEAEEVEESLGDGSAKGDGALGEAKHERTSSVEEEASKDGRLHEHVVVNGAPPTSSSDPVEIDDGAAAVLEDKPLQGPGNDNCVDDLFAGNEEDTNTDAAIIANSEAVKRQSSFGVINGAVDNDIFDGELKEEEFLGSEGGEEKCSVAGMSVALLAGDAESEVTSKESGVQCGGGADDNLDVVGTISNKTQEHKPSEMEEHIGYTEEEKTLNSSERAGGIWELEKDEEALEVVAVSVDSGEAEQSVPMPSHLSSFGRVEESFPAESKDQRNEIEQASANLQENSKSKRPKLDAHESEMSSAREVGPPSFLSEDTKTEQPDGDTSMVFDVVDYENAPVTFIADSEQKNNTDDGSEATDDAKYMGLNEESEEDGVVADRGAHMAVLRNSEAAKHFRKELEGGSLGPGSGFGNSQDYSDEIDGQIASDSDEELASDEEEVGKELFDSAALTALLKAAAGASADDGITITTPDTTGIFSVDRPAGLGSSIPSLKPAPSHVSRMNIFSPSDLAVVGGPEISMDEEEKKLQEKVELIRVKFLRLVHRLGYSPEDRVAAQVLYRLGLAEGIRRGRQIGRAFSLENAKKKALQLEEEGKEPLDFSCNILVLGKTGVGKSATINSIFGEEKVHTSAYDPATTSIKEIIGTVEGVKVRVIDTPGLKSSVMDQNANNRILTSINKYTRKCPPDIVLYVDRLDTQTWDFNDSPLLRSIASSMGSSVWFNAIVALTHSASAPPDGPSGSPLSYDVFVDQRSRIVQHAIRQAAGDMRLMNPVALVENHPSCRRNREGQQVLPNGLSWRNQMLILCYSSKILSEANSVLKLQEPSPGKLFGFRVRSPPLPFLLSSLLQSRAHPKLTTDQGVDNGDSDIDMGDLSDSDQEQEDEYDHLPPFKPLRKAQIAKLTKEQRKAYFDEYYYRVKLLQKKQWKEELRRSKELKKRGQAGQDESVYGDTIDDYDHQDGAPAAIPVPLPDMVLPPSFDCDNPAYRYRFLEPTSQLLVRPVLDSHGWDHDCGYDGVSLEENHAIFGKFPAGISVQITKDKKEFNIHLDSSISARHGETGSTLAGFDIQSVGKQLAYILRSETKFKNWKKNKTAAGISVTFLGENIATGLKVEDQLLIGKRLCVVASSGAVRAQGDMAYGANLEMRLRDMDFPVGQDLFTLGLSLMRWRRDLALGANLQSQFSIGCNSKMAVRVGLNNKLSGQITVRTSTSEQLQIALLGIFPIAVSVFRSIWSTESD